MADSEGNQEFDGGEQREYLGEMSNDYCTTQLINGEFASAAIQLDAATSPSVDSKERIVLLIFQMLFVPLVQMIERLDKRLEHFKATQS